MEYFQLTTPQKNIWNLQKYYDDTAVSNICGAIFYKEKRDNSLLKQALCMFIRNHSGIRLCFSDKDESMQYVSEKINEEIPVMTFASMEEFDRYAKKYAKEPIKLTDKFLYRFLIFEAEGKSGVLVVLSHLISDAWTFSLMAGQVDAAYHNLAEGEDHVLLESDYTEYIEAEKAYLHSERYQKDKTYWEEKYATRPEKNIIKISSANTESIEAKRITKMFDEREDFMYKLFGLTTTTQESIEYWDE